MADEYSSYFKGKIMRHIAENSDNPDCDGFRPDTTISRLKPLHAGWMINAIATLGESRDVIKRGWFRTGIRTSE